jgi:hypothetical protein
MYPVIGVGAPSYTSGVHMWNGAAATLKPNPTRSSAIPASSIGLSPRRYFATVAPIVARFVDPVAPYVNAMPYKRNAVENAPSRKYLIAASAERALRRLSPASTYTAIDMISMPRKMIIRSRAAARIIMPLVENSTSTCDSGASIPSRVL